MSENRKYQALAAMLLAAGFLSASGGAEAQTATKLDCSGCVKSRTIKNNGVKAKDLHRSIKPPGIDYVEGNDVDLTADYQSATATTINAPGPGYAVVTASWYFAGDEDDAGRCRMDTSAGSDGGPFTFALANGNTNFRDSTSMTWAFAVPAGPTSFHLNCNGDGNSMSVQNPIMTAMFFPQFYGPNTPD